MDINKLELKFQSNGKMIEVGKGKSFRLLNINGIESGDNGLYITANTMGDGSRVTNRKIKDRSIMIEAEYVGKNKEIERSKLINFFNLHSKGNLIIYYGNRKRKIEYIPQKFRSKIENINMPLKFLLDLYCPDPFFKDLVESKEDVSIETGNFSFPLHIPPQGLELSIRTINFITNIFNPGDVKTPIRVHLRAMGTVANPIIESLNTGEFIKVKRTLVKGDTLEINTEFGNKRVEIIKPDGSRENVFHYIDYKSEFFSIEAGDTTIKYDADIGENNLDVLIYYTPKYLGV